jgi:hypothetical protein
MKRLVTMIAAVLLCAGGLVSTASSAVVVSIGDRPYYVHGPYYYAGPVRYVWVPGHYSWRHHHRVWMHGYYVHRGW